MTFSAAIEKACSFASEMGMVKEGECVVAGISGGADSVFLFHALLAIREQTPFRLLVAHLNHGLRNEADSEMAFVRKMCQNEGVVFHGGILSPGELAGTDGMSLEMAARDKRKHFLNAIADAHGAEKIALGHNLSDHVETMLMHIHRGAGLRGLSGIHPVRGRVIRPLLKLSGAEIRDALAQNGIQYRIDTSNFDSAFLRNRVRSCVWPALMESFGPGFSKMWLRLSENASDTMTAFRTLLVCFLGSSWQQDRTGIRVDRRILEPAPDELLKEILLFLLEKTAGSTYFATADMMQRLLAFSRGNGYGEVDIHPRSGIKVVRSGHWLYLLKEWPDVQLEIMEPGEYGSWFQERFSFIRENAESNSLPDADVLFLDETLFPFPFQLAPVDFTSDSMLWQGREVENIREFLKKKGFGKLERDRVPVLKHGSRILWIPEIGPLVSGTEKAGRRIAVYFTRNMR